MHRFSFILYIMLIPAVLLSSCTQKSEQRSETESEELDLQGSWKRIEWIDYDEGPEWLSQDENVSYEKHITPTHFTWVAYDMEADQLVGAGGGTYSMIDGNYVEDIEFFHPLESNELGQTITFDARLEDGIWYHTGYAKIMELDPETGDNIVVDSSKIEEKWVRIAGANKDANMLKTWHRRQFRGFTDSTYNTYPDFIGYIKLLTPSRFVWVQFNNEENGGDVVGLGSGSWRMSDGNYVEEILVNTDPGVIGTTITFDYDISDDNKWYHKGVLYYYEDSEAGERTLVDSSRVDEIWVPEQ